MSLIYNCTFPKYDWVFVDEAQDVSDIQRAILKRLAKPTTRYVFVGDEKQAIYGFRGSNPESIKLLKRDFAAKSLPLSICYRCPQSVIEEAKKIVPQIEAAPGAPLGIVKNLGGAYRFGMFEPTDMILCRNNGPLVALAYKLIANHIPCMVKGREIGTGLIKLIDKLKAHNIPELSRRLGIWRDKEIEKLTAGDPDANIEPVMDKFESLTAMIRATSCQTIIELKTEITNMFKLGGESSEPILTLSSIHKSKGLEAPRVFVLSKHLMPSRYAKKDWEIVQEFNIIYVCTTRAKEALYFIEEATEDVEQDKLDLSSDAVKTTV
jgi:DNA helicase-2/ATP-dependent DNA helicase PcrA